MAGQAMPTTFEGVKTSPNLTLSLSRATDHARELHQPIVTIEHLLLALTEDPDATGSLEACGVDLARLKTDIASFVSKTAATADTSQFVDEPRQSPQLRGMIDQAAEAAREARRQEINSFIVLAAIVGQEKSDAAAILQSHGFTFNEAIAALKPRPARADAGGTKRAANPDRYDTAGTAAAELPIAPVPIPAAQPATAAEVAAAMARSAESLPPLPVAPPRVLQARPIPSQSLPAGEALVPSPMPRPAPELRQPDARPHPGHGGDEPPSVQPVAVPGRRQPQSVDDIMASVRDKSGQRLPPGRDAPTSPPLASEPPQPPLLRPGPPPGALADGPQGQRRPPVPEVRPTVAPPPAMQAAPAMAAPAMAGAPRPAPLPAPAIGLPAPIVRRPSQVLANRPPSPMAPGAPGPSMPAPSMPPPAAKMPGATRRQPDVFDLGPPLPDERISGAGPGRPARDPEADPPARSPAVARRREPTLGAPPPAPPQIPPPVTLAPGPPRGPMPVPGPQPVVRSASPRSPSLRTSNLAAVNPGQLAEAIPRTMRVAIPERVEVRIARRSLEGLAAGIEGRGPAGRHDIIITSAMSVRLKAPDGGFAIDGISPETQWIENRPGLISGEEFASWRWTVRPLARGRGRLHLIVSARTAGPDGSVAETALPDQVIEVRVRINYGQAARRWFGWIVAAMIGGALAQFGGETYEILRRIAGL